VVVQAAGEPTQQSRAALETLCQSYWYPLYALVRGKGNDRPTSEDLTQAFFAHLLQRGRLQVADPQRGKFRTFLLAALDNFLKNEWRRQTTKKRGGNQTLLSLDFDSAEERFVQEPADKLTPERLFERSWAINLVRTTLGQLSDHYRQAGKQRLFAALQSHLSGRGGTPYAELAEQLGMSEAAVKVNVYRMRQKCQELLRASIAETVDQSTDIDAEIGELFKILGTE